MTAATTMIDAIAMHGAYVTGGPGSVREISWSAACRAPPRPGHACMTGVSAFVRFGRSYARSPTTSTTRDARHEAIDDDVRARRRRIADRLTRAHAHGSLAAGRAPSDSARCHPAGCTDGACDLLLPLPPASSLLVQSMHAVSREAVTVLAAAYACWSLDPDVMCMCMGVGRSDEATASLRVGFAYLSCLDRPVGGGAPRDHMSVSHYYRSLSPIFFLEAERLSPLASLGTCRLYASEQEKAAIGVLYIFPRSNRCMRSALFMW